MIIVFSHPIRLADSHSNMKFIVLYLFFPPTTNTTVFELHNFPLIHVYGTSFRPRPRSFRNGICFIIYCHLSEIPNVPTSHFHTHTHTFDYVHVCRGLRTCVCVCARFGCLQNFSSISSIPLLTNKTGVTLP